MSVLSHLTSTASKAVLSSTENASIATSISTLQERLKSYFGTDVTNHFKFGSYTRDTILPRRIDESSDVDYMIVFKDETSKPQTYLDRLKRFVESKYATSEIFQSSPTIVLNLSHIRFELVPALAQFYGGYKIPGPASGYTDWIATDPHAFSSKLNDANKAHDYEIKPLIRLVKYWNAHAGQVYASFGLEQYLVDYAWPQTNLKDYLYRAFDSLTLQWDVPQWRKDKLERAKTLINNTRNYERQDMPSSAETEIKKLLPEIYN
jgi:predicted nucleotidyltransferase